MIEPKEMKIRIIAQDTTKTFECFLAIEVNKFFLMAKLCTF